MNESQVFADALKLATPAERAAYLDGACAGNLQLRADVEALLRVQAQDPDFLERAPVPRAGNAAAKASREPTGTECPGDVIGAYKLIELIAEGGMGTVWMAQQTEPVKRLVAMKLIKVGMDSRQVIARFEAERQALAMMEHPNIARVLDAGTTPIGRPYFVMDLVKGVPITRYCDEHRLTPRQRLELFIPVCQAIQHAHQKGIIHRDLKPSNVLVAPCDGKPVPKVIDFGVAKAAGQTLTEKTLVTGFGAIVGTLEYMSPEQAEINQLDIDTRSDIYSLGVLLYELLAGTPPFSRKETDKGGLLGMLRAIREEEPTKPSTKLSTAEGLPTLAANRGTEPAKLTRLLRGDLDWIVMKALEKDRSRRYGTATGFALDVQRYLADEPVQACPPSAVYRFRKFARRNKLALGATAAVVLLALGTATVLAVSNAAIDRKQQETTRALAAETEAREELQKAVNRERRNYYGYAFELARRDWLAGDIDQARRRLPECPAEFRDRDWQYLHRVCNAELVRIEPPKSSATTLRYSSDGKYLAAYLPSGARIAVWDAVTGRERAILPTMNPISGLAFSPDGNELIWVTDGRLSPAALLVIRQPAAARGFEATVWNLASGRRTAGFRRENSGEYAVLSPDGARLMLVAKKRNAKTFESTETVSIRDTRSGRELRVLSTTNQIASAALLPDGNVLIGSAREKEIQFWDTVTGQMTRKVDTDAFHRLALSPDGKRLAAGSLTVPGHVKVLDVQTFRELATFRAHAGSVTGLAFSPDGRRLATSSSDKTVIVWDVDTGRELLTLRGHTHGIWDVAFSPDGNRLASSSRTVRIWDVSQSDTPAK